MLREHLHVGAHAGARFLAALPLARLLVIPVRPDFAHDAFFIELLLQAAEGFVHRFAFAYFHFGHVYVSLPSQVRDSNQLKGAGG